MIAVANFQLLPFDVSCKYGVLSELILKIILLNQSFSYEGNVNAQVNKELLNPSAVGNEMKQNACLNAVLSWNFVVCLQLSLIFMSNQMFFNTNRLFLMCMYGKRVIKSFYDTCKDKKKIKHYSRIFNGWWLKMTNTGDLHLLNILFQPFLILLWTRLM